MIKVVIAEDDFRVASIHEQFLSKIKGVHVVGKALNAKETSELLEQNEVDLLLLDVYMPDKLGTSLLPEIRGHHPKVDIIMITAATEKEVVEDSIRNGVLDYIIKPVTLERFTNAIDKYKKRKNLFTQQQEFDQELVDTVIGNSISSPIESELPKGIDPLTLKKVREIMNQLKKGVNAEEVGEYLGASRTTARRYLEYLISVELAKAELEYGIVGRPERKYYLTKSTND
ncbi:response regulator [Cytobacillus sp. S13-E01]|uniref:response regulator n=1 Tax=Cytobacillus sp. S13-E01 TaxID=3031326 RepID=UPI0023D8A373|nr:response regulator [Cytobacillus sp. S13-E01]MDF0726022.1 response regulator [Cytobacillus sp. S13-E01]